MNPNDPAFPTPSKDYPGVYVRIYIATHALQGLLASGWDVPYEEMAIEALCAANALIEQEKKH